MAAEVVPAAFHSWTFHKNQTLENSPDSMRSSSGFLETEEKLRVTPSMAEIKAAIEKKAELFSNKEYQSSEEALSPMADNTESEEDEFVDVDEILDSTEDSDDGLWDVELFNVDMAIAICIIAVGQPRMIKIASPSTSISSSPISPRTDNMAPKRILAQRSDSLPPSIPVRSIERQPIRRLQTQFSKSSIKAFHSDLPTPTDELASPTSYSSKRKASIFTTPSPDLSSTYTPPLSEHNSGSTSPSYLQDDLSERTSKSSRSSHSRLKSFSSRFTFSSKSSSEDKENEPTKIVKKQRRSSIRGALHKPSTPLSNRNSRSIESLKEINRPITPQPIFIAPLRSNSGNRSFPRMVARGASERQAAFILPECPDSYDAPDPTPLMRCATEKSGVADFVPRSRKGMSHKEHIRRRKSLLGLAS